MTHRRAVPNVSGTIMINVFALNNGRLNQLHIDTLADLQNSEPVWIDLVAPSDEVRSWISELYQLTLPDFEDLRDIEASARFFETPERELHLRSDFLLEGEDLSRNISVAFILHKSILFSLHEEDLPVFRLVRMRARTRPGEVQDARDVLLDLYAADAEYSADALEGVYAELEKVSNGVLTRTMTDQEAATVLAAIAHEEDLNGRIRRNVLDTRRAVSFLLRKKLLSSEQFEEARQILGDIETLDNHTGFLFDKINFLMDATVGFININQNKIIKIFSVASVALLPPTLIASIYGMNFRILPELQWDWGYPFALGLMVFSVVVPFWYFKRRGWLS
jgi:magnesium transporter